MEKEFLEGLGLAPEVVEAIWQQKQLDEQAHADQLRRQTAEHALQQAVAQAGGRNAVAIRALVDEEAVFTSADPATAARQAVAKVKRENGYLFQAAQPYAAGTGSARVMADYSMEELGAMSMAEYRRLRRG